MKTIFIVYSTFGVTIFAILLIANSFWFRNDAFGLIEDYENWTQIWEIRRIKCYICTNESSLAYPQGNCQRERDGCYQKIAEEQAALLDYNELIREPRDYFMKFIDDYKFTTYGSGEVVIKKKLAKLMSYPKSWITITSLGIAFGIFQLILIATLAIVSCSALCSEQYNNMIEKSWIGAFIIWFLLSLSLFISALVQKINYTCPGQKYESKYGGSGHCSQNYTYGKSIVRCLGTDLVNCAIASCILLRDFFNSRTNK